MGLLLFVAKDVACVGADAVNVIAWMDAIANIGAEGTLV